MLMTYWWVACLLVTTNGLLRKAFDSATRWSWIWTKIKKSPKSTVLKFLGHYNGIICPLPDSSSAWLYWDWPSSKACLSEANKNNIDLKRNEENKKKANSYDHHCYYYCNSQEYLCASLKCCGARGRDNFDACSWFWLVSFQFVGEENLRVFI